MYPKLENCWKDETINILAEGDAFGEAALMNNILQDKSFTTNGTVIK